MVRVAPEVPKHKGLVDASVVRGVLVEGANAVAVEEVALVEVKPYNLISLKSSPWTDIPEKCFGSNWPRRKPPTKAITQVMAMPMLRR